jgi:Flp pilus assembly protein TadD
MSHKEGDCRKRLIAQIDITLRSSPKVHDHLATTLFSKDDVDGAITELRAATSQQPNFPQAHNDLGTALFRKGDRDGAIVEFRTAINQQPNFPAVQSLLDKALATKNKSEPGNSN